MAIGNNVSNLIFSSGVSANNVSTGETTLATFTLPANTLSQNGQLVKVSVWGTVASNTNTKTLKAYFGATATTLDNFTTSAALTWFLTGYIIRTGMSTQTAAYNTTANVTTTLYNSVKTASPTENTANAITVKFTGTGGATNDIVLSGMVVEVLD